MNRRGFLKAGALLPAAWASATYAADDEGGFSSLFDGKTLSGWSVQAGPESAFFVEDGAIVVHHGSNFPTWLRSDKRYENFDYRGEFFIQGWIDSGIYLHAPDHGERLAHTGLEIKLFHQAEEHPQPYGCGSIFPIVAPKLVNVKGKGEWNTFRILMDWPSLKVWMNGEMVQDVNLESNPELRYRLRRGYLGFESLSYPIRFRNLRIRELPDKEKWTALYEEPGDLSKWFVSEGKPKPEAVGEVLRLEGLGHYATKEKYRDFELHAYIRSSANHNGGVMFRTEGKGSPGVHYEIQLHNVEGAHFPTGSLYHYKRAIYPHIQNEQWYLLQLIVKDKYCLVRINGENVMEYNELDNLNPGHIELQAHASGTWEEFKHLRIKPA